MIYTDPLLFREGLPDKGRLLGCDVGDQRIGLALCDVTRTIATALSPVKRKSFTATLETFKQLIQNEQIQGLVVGWPLNMNGSTGPRCQSTRQFVKNLTQHCPLPCLLWDERLTTLAATGALLEADMSRQKRQELVDSVAAVLILQNALDRLKQDAW
jgi:putative Holliday junction resolvase